MAWFDEFNLPGATVDGYFGFIRADGPDEDDYPDVVLADGWVTFKATTPAARVDGAWLGIETVHAQIFEGQIVVSEEDPRPVRLLATDAPIGVADWAWTATFNLDGFTLAPLTFRAPRDTTVSLTADLIPIKSQPYQIIEGASIVDAEVSGEGTMRFALSDGSYTAWINVPNGPKGAPGEKGEQGNDGPPGVAATVEMGSVSAGVDADAWMSGPPERRELHLQLPRGPKGEQGIPGSFAGKGDKGDKGDPGDGVLTHDTPTGADLDMYYTAAHSGHWRFSRFVAETMTGLPPGFTDKVGSVLVLGSPDRVATQIYFPYGGSFQPPLIRSIVSLSDNAWSPWAPLQGGGSGFDPDAALAAFEAGLSA